MEVMDSIVFDVLKKLGREAAGVCENGKNKVLTDSTVEAAVRLCFPGKLSIYAMEHGRKAVEAFKAFKK